MIIDADARRLPRYAQIKRTLIEAIRNGEYEPGALFLTQPQVCERFGVSTTTATKALGELVAEGFLVRRQGRGTFVTEHPPVDERPPPAAGPVVACVVYDGESSHVTGILRGIEEACRELGHRPAITYTWGSPTRESTALREAVRTGAAGVIIYPLDGGPDPEVLAEVRRAGTPLVLVDRYRADVPTDAVVADNFDIGFALTRELIAAGHHRIATLWSETRSTSVADRQAGHLRALRTYDVPVVPEFTALRSYTDLPEERRRAHLRSLLTAAHPPTALLCSNGYVLAAVTADLIALGRHVPQDIELAGMDSIGPYELFPLAALAAVVPSEEMGRQAVRLVAERAAGPGAGEESRHVVLPITVRES